MIDLWGNVIKEDVLLRDKFIEPPFSILDTKTGSWLERKRRWKAIGIKSELGRDAAAFEGLKASMDNMNKGDSMPIDISIFDPALCEVIYHWFCPEGGTILDPFAGGSVRGIVANYLGFNYTGIDISERQIESNIEQAKIIIPGRPPTWLVGDSNVVLDAIEGEFDFVFSCPPYFDLEVYSDDPGDISNMSYPKFLEAYESIIKKSCAHLKPGGLAGFVVGEVRGKDGNYIGFVPDTIRAFQKAGMGYYNEAILLNAIVSAAFRASNNMKYKKLVKVHQNVLIFKKPLVSGISELGIT